MENTTVATLPVLTGSPKQIAWAERIRTTGLASIEATLAEFEAAVASGKAQGTAAQIETMRASLNSAASKAAAQTTATWWIEHQMVGRQLLKAVQA